MKPKRIQEEIIDNIAKILKNLYSMKWLKLLYYKWKIRQAVKQRNEIKMIMYIYKAEKLFLTPSKKTTIIYGTAGMAKDFEKIWKNETKTNTT